VVKRRLLQGYANLCKPSQQQTDAGQSTTPTMRLEAAFEIYGRNSYSRRAFSHVKPYRAASPPLRDLVIRIYRYLTYGFIYNVEA